MTHTPGPWHYHLEPTLNRFAVRAGFGGDRSICVTYGAGMKSYEAEANARLIAAAPDMLNLLRKCCDVIERLDRHKTLLQRIRATYEPLVGLDAEEVLQLRKLLGDTLAAHN